MIKNNSAIKLGSVKSVLKCLRSNHPQQIVVGNLNINSIRKKFDIMESMLMYGVGIFVVTETKLIIPFQFHNLMLKVLTHHLD